MPSVSRLHFSMPEEDIIEHTNAKCHEITQMIKLLSIIVTKHRYVITHTTLKYHKWCRLIWDLWCDLIRSSFLQKSKQAACCKSALPYYYHPRHVASSSRLSNRDQTLAPFYRPLYINTHSHSAWRVSYWHHRITTHMTESDGLPDFWPISKTTANSTP